MAIRKKQEPSEYQKALCKFHKKSNRHVVVFEADISEDEMRPFFDADHLRKCGNELLGIMERNLGPLSHKEISCLAETVWKSIGSNPCTGKERSSIR